MNAPEGGSARALKDTAEGHDGTGGERAAGRPARRGSADPVRALMHRHHALCAHAVDALEIAAGLEAHGVTDRTAARFRHRDVFSLAEELYARVPRADQGAAAAAPGGGGAPGDRPAGGPDAGDAYPEAGIPEAGGRPVRGWGGRCAAVLQLLPGAVTTATVVALAALASPPGAAPRAFPAAPATPAVRTAVGAAGVVLIVLAVRLAVRSGPLRVRHRGTGAARTAALWVCVCWAAGYAVYGDWLLGQLLAGGPDLPSATPRADVAAALALSLAVLPAAGGARWFARRGRRALATSRGLEEFAARVRPLLLGATLLFLGALTALLLGARAVLGSHGAPAPAVVAPAALGVLLFLARLLAVHGFPEAAATGLACAAALEALAAALVLSARLPGLTPLGLPVETLTTAAGPAAVPAVAAGVAALGLLGYGLRALTGACAHASAPTGPAGTPRP
ncbi:hypothetical protein [Streptomyces lydicus]|uniref:Integral membrane protein n=1 Tax=Streptomyces lydicus TaxID=47763 RepID=A0A1D7VT29_9ACTN|nr:hypothetical protein [Streptomyces lydicus]AOP49910.1 hypothetical protein SL103_29960 [Streptomyces lydicus]